MACTDGGDSSPTTTPADTTATAEPAPTATTAPSPTPTRVPGRVTLHLDPLAPADDRAIVAGGVDHAVRYLEAATGFPAVDVDVFMYVLPQRLSAELAAAKLNLPIGPDLIAVRLQSTASEAFPGAFAVDPTSRPWLLLNDLNHFRIAAHEYFHVVQFALMGDEASALLFATPIAGERVEGPNWLFEGSAEYVSWKALEAAGLAELDVYLAANPVAQDADLRSRETPFGAATADDAGLVMPLAAVQFLLGDGGPAPLLAFYEAIGRGTPWRDAFTTAFGRPLDVFYDQFASR